MGTTPAKHEGRVTTPPVKLPATKGWIGFTVHNKNFLYNPASLSDEAVDEIWKATGRTEIQIGLDMSVSPGRVSISRFLQAASICAGRPITEAEARETAREHMNEAKELEGDALAEAIAAMEADRPKK